MVVFALVAVFSAVVIALAVLGFAFTLLALSPLLPNGLTTTNFRERRQGEVLELTFYEVG